MKKFRKMMLISLAAVMVCTAGAYPQAAETETASASSEESASEAVLKKRGGKYYCYVNGKKIRNAWKKINGKKYYFGADGAAKTGCYTLKKGRKYYTYYFTSRGVYRKSRRADAGLVRRIDRTIKSAGTKEALSVRAQKKTLKKLYQYLSSDKFGYRRSLTPVDSSNAARYASDFLRSRRGSCYHFAAAFAYTAKRATGLSVRIVVGRANALNADRMSRHAWVEVKISGKWYIYDTNAGRFSARTDINFCGGKASSSAMKKTYVRSTAINVNI